MTLSDTTHPSPRWDHLARWFVIARKRRGWRSLAEAERQTGIPYSTLKEFEKGPWPSPRRTEATDTMIEYADLLGWTPDSIDVVLAGGEPTEKAKASDVWAGVAAVAAGATAEEKLKIVREIQSSNLSDELKAYLTKGVLG